MSYCGIGYHHPIYCTCPATCTLCGIATDHTTERHDEALDLVCPDCGVSTKDGERCGECLSVRAEYYTPEEGGSC